MTPSQFTDWQELDRLIDGACDQCLSAEELALLGRWLTEFPEACNRYIACMDTHGRLGWVAMPGKPFSMRELVHYTRVDCLSVDERTGMSAVIAASIPPMPVASHGTWSWLSPGWPVAYLVASVLMGIGALIGSITYVSPSSEVRSRPPLVATAPVNDPSSQVSVGQITGMVNCKWSHSPQTIAARRVALGQNYSLASGLLEITYDTGAKVILQGPVTYVVESPAGGYLSVGKLTARLEEKSEVRAQRSESADHPSEIVNQKFVVRTPTAVVTDLGTEFGVEVDKSGATQSRVFRGSIRVQRLIADGTADTTGQVLRENESAWVGHDGNDKIAVTRDIKPTGFVRTIPKRAFKILDLVDVVAGGDGFSGRRNAGIDPTSGRVAKTPPKIGKDAKDFPFGDRKYHRVDSLPFVDGVFIPDGSTGPVQVDSAGHVFDDFGKTENRTAGYVWAGGALPDGQPTVLGRIDYATPNHGALGMHANKGITFDLEAIRRANPGYRVVRFLATTGNTEPFSQKAETVYADTGVLVDGQMRFKRREITNFNGAMPINIPIAKNDRFLTLVATDGGNTIAGDWIMFGDPRLELAPDETAADSTPEKSR